MTSDAASASSASFTMTLEASAASATDKRSLEIVSLLGERVCITLAPSATIADLRSKLAATPPFVGLCNVNIVHRGRQLDADAGSSLSDEGIADGDVIHAFFSTSASMSTSRSFAAPLEGSRCSSSGCGAAPRYVLRSRFDALEGRVEALELRLERALRTIGALEDELVAERERGSTLLSEASSRIAQGPWASECDRDG